MIEQTFLQCAKAVHVDARIALLIAYCDRALEACPDDRDRRWYWRIEDQRRRLLDPDFRLYVAVTSMIAEDHPALARLVAVALGRVVVKHPELRPFRARLIASVARGETGSLVKSA